MATFLAASGAQRAGRSPSRALWTMRQSSALQTLTRRVFALNTMALPISKSPEASKYVFTTPAPVSMQGMRALSRTKSMSRRPPRGMTTST